jgi:hypothetical protein
METAGVALINQLQEDYVRARNVRGTETAALRCLTNARLDLLEVQGTDQGAVDTISCELSELRGCLAALLREDDAATATSIEAAQKLLLVDSPMDDLKRVEHALIRASGQLFSLTFQDVLRMLLDVNIDSTARRYNPHVQSESVSNAVSVLGTAVLRIIRMAQVTP